MAFKIDPEWRDALSLLPQKEARKAFEMIEEYRRTGTAPCGMSFNMRMIFLLVKPTIDRRRRASEAARRRRLEKKNASPSNKIEKATRHEKATTNETLNSRIPYGDTLKEDKHYGDNLKVDMHYGEEVFNLLTSHVVDTKPSMYTAVENRRPIKQTSTP